MEDVVTAASVRIRPQARAFAQPDLSRSRWTPLVELAGLDAGCCRVLGKLENMTETTFRGLGRLESTARTTC